MKTISLNGIWKLSGRPEGNEASEFIRLNGTVPGMVQLDLSREGILPSDLYMGENILETEKLEGYEWWYERTFIAPNERERVFLVFRGVDCVAEYYLNGAKIGESENMFIPVEFEVGKHLIDGENTLTVHIKSPLIYAHNHDYDMMNISTGWNSPMTTYIRRAPHTYGWDIMPRAVTSGIWREVRLEVRDEISFAQAFFDFNVAHENKFCYVLDSSFDAIRDNVEIEINASCGDSSFECRFPIKERAGKYDKIRIKNKKLWWPYGYGEPNVYDATLRIYKNGALVHEKKTSFGIRTVKLERTNITDGVNGAFRFIVNGVEVMCRGTNWVPLDAFHSRDAERYDEALELLRDSGSNIVRCWGGNVYEDERFFDFCDRHGIMVWQDFAMACNSYPQTEKFYESIRREATFIVREYRHHPSIIVWSGDNEIDCMHAWCGVNPEGNKITREVLPSVVYANDVGRPYLESSPFITEEVFKTGNLDYSPEGHLWGSRDYYKSDFNKHAKHHFVSETGFHGCPSLESIKKFITPEKVWPYFDNSEWILHSSDQKGNDSRVMLMDYQVRQMFGEVPTDAESYILASQISQAEAKKYFIERIRVARPRTSGIIWWNLLDGWPQMSDAVVDYYFDKKLAYGYIKRSQQPFAIILDELYDRTQKIYACNDTLSDISGKVTVIDSETDKVLFEADFTAPKNSSTVIGGVSVEYSEHKLLYVKWEVDGKEYFNHYITGFMPHSLEKYKSWIEKYSLDEN